MILIDTDVLLDVALGREPHQHDSARLLDWLESSRRRAFVAWHSLSNFYYLVRPGRGGEDARSFLEELTRFLLVAPTDTDALRYAAELPMKDFEDALQVAAARACGVETIVTRNVADYDGSPIPAVTPTDFLAST